MPKHLLRKLLLTSVLLIPVLLVLAVALYAAAGFWWAPRLIRSQASDYVRTELHKDLRLGEIRTNPFTFELDIGDAAIVESGRPLVAAKRLYADFQVSSLWKRAYTFRKIAIEAPFARAIIRADGSLNLADLLPESDSDEPIPSILIESLAVSRGRVDFADRSRRLQPAKTLAPINFALRDFRTSAQGGGFSLDARGDGGEGFTWKGKLSLEPVASAGQFAVSGLQASDAYKFLSDVLPFELRSGRFDFGGRYTFSVRGKAGMQLEATLPSVKAVDLALRAQGIDNDWVTVPALALDDTRLSLGRREVAIKALRVDRLQAQLWLEPDGSVNLMRLFGDATPAASTAPAAGPALASSAPAQTTAGDWKFSLARLALQQGKIEFEDRMVKPAARFVLSPLALSADALSLDLAKPVPITLQTTINGRAPLSISGEVVPATTAATLQVELAKLPLRDLLAYLPDYPTLTLRSGVLGAKGKLALLPEAEPGPSLSFDGDATVANFDLVERQGQREFVREFVSWDRVDVQGIAYRAGPDEIAIRRINARKPYARVIIAPDGKLNLVTILAAPTPASAQSAAKPAPAPPLRIGEVVLDAGTMSFADFSIEPNFQARIDALKGRITGLSTANDSVAKIDLNGQIINRFSPVTIVGQTNLFAYDQHTDIAMAFKNIELPIFNPYSGRFAGYAIAKGKLTTELHYRIDDRKLVADHHVILDQLQWGAATDSKDKVSLPIRLATALLKDRHGVIDLKLPVTGSLDDPKFRIGPIVWQIIKNIVVKVVTAPFSFLGSLFKGAEDAQYVDFAPGSAVLPDKARASLPELAKSLADRPALNIDIPAGPATAADVAALDDQRFQAAITTLRAGRRGAATTYAELDDEDKIDVLKDLYRQEFGKKPELPDAADAAALVEPAAVSGAPPASAVAASLPAPATADTPAPSEVVATVAVPALAEASASPEVPAAVDALVPSDIAVSSDVPVSSAAPAIAEAPAVAESAAPVAAKDMTRRERKASRRQTQVAWLEGQLRPPFKSGQAELTALAQARATAVQEALLAGGELDPARVFLAGNLAPVDKDNVVRLELGLK